METRALRYFQTVAECGSYSRGAELLRISQPAVSRQIGKLEEELGARLFNRHAHGVNLTEAGQILLARCQRCCANSSRRGRKSATVRRDLRAASPSRCRRPRRISWCRH